MILAVPRQRGPVPAGHRTRMRLFASLLPFALAVAASAQHLTYEEWLRRAMVDMRLQPRFGDQPKNEAQVSSDAEFTRLMLEQEPDRRKASEQLLLHGFDLLRKGEMPAAMNRFNQAYLLDSTNADVHWGYGTFFMMLDRPGMAHRQYEQGLALDSTSVRLLTADAAAYLNERGAIVVSDPAAARSLADRAFDRLLQAQRHHPDDPGMLYRLSVCHLLRGECDEAWRAYRACKDHPEAPIDPGYPEYLRGQCPE